MRFGIWDLRSAFLMVLVVLLLRRMIASSGPQMVVVLAIGTAEERVAETRVTRSGSFMVSVA